MASQSPPDIIATHFFTIIPGACFNSGRFEGQDAHALLSIEILPTAQGMKVILSIRRNVEVKNVVFFFILTIV